MADVTTAHVRLVRAIVEAVYRAGEDLLGKSQRLAPIEEGTLRGSAALVMIVNGTRHEGEGAKAAALAHAEALARAGRDVDVDAEVSFNTVYAARQHEETTWRHPLDGQAKYAEQPLRENAARYAVSVERAARASL